VIPVGPSNPSALASAHIFVTVGGPQGSASIPQSCYTQEGGCGAHAANGGTAEQNITVIANTGSTPVKGL